MQLESQFAAERNPYPDSVRPDNALVWEIDRTLQEEGARPVLYHMRGATCWHPRLKGLTTMVNSMYNGWRLEDVWLED
jgi:peptide/nickel transport system substrate-binding protein